MSEPRAPVAVYRHALRLYPRRFRDEYGPDLLLLLTDQLRDESTWRVVARTAVDLAITVPTRHMEAHMNRPARPLLPALFGGIALSSIVVGLVVGHPAVLLICLAVGSAATALAVVAVRRTHSITEPRPTTAHWWKLLATGGGLLAALIAITTATGELPDGGWLAAMITGLAAILLLCTGAVLGIAHLASRSTRHVAT